VNKKCDEHHCPQLFPENCMQKTGEYQVRAYSIVHILMTDEPNAKIVCRNQKYSNLIKLLKRGWCHTWAQACQSRLLREALIIYKNADHVELCPLYPNSRPQ
jgi:hypothetical protein